MGERPRPRPVPLDELLSRVPNLPTLDPIMGPVPVVTGITHDSREVRAGDLYLALPGRVTHGARFSVQAVQSGAVAVMTDAEGAADAAALEVPLLVVDDPRSISGRLSAAVYGWPARDLQILGVTGTNGKTTVTAMVRAGLEHAGLRAGVVGTVGIHIDGSDLPATRTTPEATDLQALLGVMRDRGVQVVIMEASSIAVVEGRLDGFRFDVVGFTHLTQDHLDYHGSMEEYFSAKARLFTPDHAAMGVVGIDDGYGRRLAQQARIPVFTWSAQDPAADWRAVDVAAGSSTMSFEVLGPAGEREQITVPMPGQYNVANALCAYGMLRTAGVSAEAAARGIGMVAVPGRMQVVRSVRSVRSATGSSVLGIVDYAHTPDAIERVIEAVREQHPGRILVVVGAGGDRDRAKRPVMGRAAARLADVLIVTDDNPRGEDPASIRAQVLDGAHEGALQRACLVVEDGDRAHAIATAVSMATEGDVVMVLGKGHEQGQEVAGVVTPFDDASILQAALEARP